MKNFPLAVILVALCVSSVHAGPQDVAKQRAKQFGNNLNAQQGVQPPPPPTAPARPSSPPAAQVPQAPTQPVNPAVAKLRSDFTALTNSTPSTEQKKQVVADLLATAQGTVKPSQQTVMKLANDLGAALAGKTISFSDQTRLSQNVFSIFNGANLSQSQVQTLALDVQTILQTAGVKRPEAIIVVADLKAIAAEVQKKP